MSLQRRSALTSVALGLVSARAWAGAYEDFFVAILRDSNRVCNKTFTVNARLARRLGRLRQPAKDGIFLCGRRARRPYR